MRVHQKQPAPRKAAMQKHFQKALDSVQPQTLYIVATPIGNLADITLRALAVLQTVDLVCAEDTRVSAQLLSAYGISAKLLSVREHNEQQMADKIIAALEGGQSVAQSSDAGTPAVCDPGAKLAARVREAGFRVVPVVGASAVMGALCVAGVSEPNFYFHGFLPPKSGERIKCFERWLAVDYPIIAFETPHRIAAALDDMMRVFPERHILLAREITKTFETFISGSVQEVQAALAQHSVQLLVGVRANSLPDRGNLRRLSALSQHARAGIALLLLYPENQQPDDRQALQETADQWRAAAEQHGWLCLAHHQADS